MVIPPEFIKLITKDLKLANLAVKCSYNIDSAEG